MILTWYKLHRRRKALANPFPEAWVAYLEQNVGHYRFLTAAEQAHLHDDLRVLIAEKHWEGCGGLALTDEIRVTIAGQAALLLLGMAHDYFPRVLSILVYPTAYRAEVSEPLAGGRLSGSEAREGEAWYRGPVVLSWADAQSGGRDLRDGRNLVLHEFAHQLDMEDRSVDGTPVLQSRQLYRRWHEVMTREYERLIEDARRGRPALLDHYGASNPAEFFAVVTECFFERPDDLRSQHAELYGVLRDYYHQDPAARTAARSERTAPAADSTPSA